MNRNDIIPANTRVRVLPGFTYCSGQRGSSSDYRELKDAFHSGGIFYSTNTDRAPDSDGDFRVFVGPNREGNSGWVHYSFIELAPEDSDTPTVSVEDAFKPGNEIEFSVENVEFTDHGLRVGCKALDFSQQAAWNAIVKIDTVAKTATFRAKINDRGWIETPTNTIDRYEAAEHFKDVKITKLGTPPRPDVTVTLTADEVDVLKALVGRTRGTGPHVAAWGKLNAAQPGQEYRQYNVTDEGRRINKD